MKTSQKIHHRLWRPLLLPLCTAAILFAQFHACAYAKKSDTNPAPLDLANHPLLSGTNVKPNVMVAVDDSGSMDSEVVTPANDGAYYWNNGDFITNGVYNNGPDNKKYIYLFPNGCNNRQKRGRRNQCDKQKRYAIPPIPQLGFTRSPDYNKAYFNPNVDYTAWTGRKNAWKINSGGLTAVPYSPEVQSSSNTIDLTTDRESDQSDEQFEFQPGMVIPAETRYYHTTSANVKISEVCDNIERDPASSATPDAVQYCKQYASNPYYSQLKRMSDLCNNPSYRSNSDIDKICNRYEQGQSKTGFYSDDADADIRQTVGYGVSYFPATFYLNSANELPDGYGYTGQTLSGTGPNGGKLVGYEIKPDNFAGGASGSAYQAAVQNFANWFTYYRKRHLAVRGAIVAAFDQIHGVRAGSCTINHRQKLNMLDLNNDNDRQAFYTHIFSIDFSRSFGTPNREALAFLGRQLETNSDIIQSKCQRNYAILFTDGYNSQSVGGFGYVDNDKYSNTIADVAMHYYKDLGKLQFANDIERHAMRTPPACDSPNHDPSLDCEKDLHMTTFGVTLGQSGTLFNGDGDNPDPYTHPPDWSSLTDVNKAFGKEQIDDLWHAAINSHGALLNAQTPQELANKFAGALKNILNAPGSASGVATNSSSLSDDSVVYRATYQDGSWSGDLKAYPLAEGIGKENFKWSAAAQLNTKAPDDRVILTSTNIDKKNHGTPIPFRASTLSGSKADTLSADQINYIRGDRSHERGYGNNQNGTLRNRGDDILGDIVHSTPIYVGAPNRYRYPAQWQDLLYPDKNMLENAIGAYSDPTTTTAFAQKYAGREPMVYVGANDGMLHGFDADTGEEKLAYIPDAVLPDLGQLTDPDYVHRYYVDGSPAVGDVVYADDNGNEAWHTVLVNGLGNGGDSVFALDITDPSGTVASAEKFSESNARKTVLWEYTDKDLGRTFGKPSIVRLHNGEWAAMFANGYNSKDGGAALYLVDIKSGHLIAKIDTGDKPKKKDPDRDNGLSEPFPVDLDGDFVTDYAYAGDLHGNLWKFDLASDNPKDWTATRLFTATDSNGNPQPITTQPQVGTHPYGKNYGVMVYFGTGKYLENGDAALDTSVQNSLYGIWDLDVFTFNTANNGQPLFTTSLKSDIPESRLTQQRVTQTVASGGSIYRVVTNNPVDYEQAADNSQQTTAGYYTRESHKHGDHKDKHEGEDGDKKPKHDVQECYKSDGHAPGCVYHPATTSVPAGDGGKRGWVLDLPAGVGELIISNPRLQTGGTISFSTTIPNLQSCTAGGSGYLMVVDSATGGRTGFPAFDLNGDDQFNSQDTVDTGDGTQAGVSGIAIDNGAPGPATHTIDHSNQNDHVTLPTSDGDVVSLNINNGMLPDRRRSWREIRR